MPLSPIRENPSADRTQASIRPVVHARLRALARADATSRIARDLTWQWVASKWPRLLPSAAGMESEHYARSAPGQQLVAASGPGGDWSLTVAFDERQGARTWVTQVQIEPADDAVLLSLQTGCTAAVDAPLVVAPPRLLGSWVERLDLRDGPVGVISEPRTVGDAAQRAHFVAHVASPARTLPIIALTNRAGTRFYGVDPAGLAMAVRGMAHVACLSPEQAAELTAELGPHLGVVPGAARIYAPGVPIAASPQHHPLLRNHHAGGSSAAQAGAFRRQLCQRICALSVLPLEQDDAPSRAGATQRHAAGA
jgi:hypothetical protein